ncbi:MAG: hypothetical protein AAGH74_09760 [Pseudomonadota bacterium]
MQGFGKAFVAAVCAVFLSMACQPAGAVTRTIAETARTAGPPGNLVIEDVFGNPTSLAAGATDDQFNQNMPTNANALLATPVFGPSDTLLMFGVLAAGQDPLLVNFATAFTITLLAVEDRGVNSPNGGGFQITRGNQVILQVLDAFEAGDRDVLLFDTRTIASGPISGLFEFRVLGNINEPNSGSLNYDISFTAVPLPMTLPLLLAALGLGFSRRRVI